MIAVAPVFPLWSGTQVTLTDMKSNVCNIILLSPLYLDPYLSSLRIAAVPTSSPKSMFPIAISSLVKCSMALDIVILGYLPSGRHFYCAYA